jgi:hypothetical protein
MQQCFCLQTIIKQLRLLSDLEDLDLLCQLLYQHLKVLSQLLFVVAKKILSLDLYEYLLKDFCTFSDLSNISIKLCGPLKLSDILTNYAQHLQCDLDSDLSCPLVVVSNVFAFHLSELRDLLEILDCPIKLINLLA